MMNDDLPRAEYPEALPNDRSHDSQAVLRTVRRRFAWFCLVLVVLVAGLVVIRLVPPSPNSFYPKCLLYKTTGLHCPGCGMTRSVHAGLKGNLGEAFTYNLLVVVILPYLLLEFLRSMWFWVNQPKLTITEMRSRLRRRSWVEKCAPWVLVLMLLFFVFRNLPWYPFTLLAPTLLQE